MDQFVDALGTRPEVEVLKLRDEVLCHLDGAMAEWSAWKRTPQGQAWVTEWAWRVATLRAAQRKP